MKAGLIELAGVPDAVDASGASVDLTGAEENAAAFEYITYLMCGISRPGVALQSISQIVS